MDKRKIGIVSIIIGIVLIIAGIVYAAAVLNDDNHYVVDVVEETAVNNDDNLQITERIVKDKGQQYHDSKKLNYEVELKSIAQKAEIETQVAFVIDSSYSAGKNDTSNILKTKAEELATEILTNVKNSSISVSNYDTTKLNLNRTLNTVKSNINALVVGNGNDGNKGLENGVASIDNKHVVSNAYDVHKYLIVFTDGTDNVKEKMKEIQAQDPDLHIITVLLDITSSAYVNDDGSSVCGDLYFLSSDESISTPQNLHVFDTDKITNEMNKSLKQISVTNVFSDVVSEYFTISDVTATHGTAQKTEDGNGYTWTVDNINFQDTEVLKFSLTLKTDAPINADVIFKEICTNKTQDVQYQTFDHPEKRIDLQGSDERQGTKSTVIKICQGYDLRIKAVNIENKDLAVGGIVFNVVGKNAAGEIVCNETATTDNNGYIKITADTARSLRSDGTITYEVTPTVNNLVGYVATNPETFEITNDNITRKIIVDELNSSVTINPPNEAKRLVDVIFPINSQKSDFEVKVTELGNTNTVISGCEFTLIQPKLNDKYQMSVLTGVTDINGSVHFDAVVMTLDGTYDYYLRQNSAPNSYDAAKLTLIKVTYKDGIITDISTHDNSNVTATVEQDKTNHVLVSVLNECVAVDPFNLQINLEDSKTGDKLSGVQYLVRTINSNNQVRSVIVETDSNGQINTNIYGAGALQIEITEQQPKAGYIPDVTTKMLTVNKNNGIVTVLYNPQQLDIDQDPNRESVIVNFKSTKKAEQNIVKVSLVDYDEKDVAVGPGVAYKLEDEKGFVYGPVQSDRKGQLSFTVGNYDEGQHKFKLTVDEYTIPDEYDESQVPKELNVNLTFDKDGYIIDEDVIENEQSLLKEEFTRINEVGSTEYTCLLTIGYHLDQSSSAEFRVQLLDKDTNRGIVGAKYNIDIEWTINGVTKTKTIEGRETNAQGLITTRITKGDPTKITVKEVAASAGYTCDITTQEIILTYRNNGGIGITQSPYDLGQTNTNEPNQGASEQNGIVTFKHLNKKRTAEDTYVNLTLDKVDMNGAFVNGVLVNLSSDTLVDENNKPLDLTLRTGDQGATGEITIDYQKYQNDPQNNHAIRVPGIGVTAEQKVYELKVQEMYLDGNREAQPKKGTQVIFRLTFRQDEGRIRLSDVVGIYGNRLIKSISYSSSSDNVAGSALEDSLGVYLGNMVTELYTNYDDVGNLSLDLKKQNQQEEELVGAEYSIRVVNPDGTTITKNNVKIDNRSLSEAIELTGITVNVESYIYITETKAPIGYALNENTETLKVTKIDPDGQVTLQQVDQAYTQNRLKLNLISADQTSAGTYKTNYEVKLTDYQLDTFKFEINAVDKETSAGINNYGFSVDTSLGAHGTILTSDKGVGSTHVGGNVSNQTVTYKITANHIADYYKPLSPATIEVPIVFDLSGSVDVTSTMAQVQNKSGYNTWWTVEDLQPSGSIKVKIKIDHQAPLNVQVVTKDKITEAVIKDVSYKITDSQVLPATGNGTSGTAAIQVGYILENGIQTYKLTQTSLKDSYQKATDKTFTISYQSEKVLNDSTLKLDSAESKDKITWVNNQTVKIEVYVEPKVPFEITNKYFFANKDPLQGANFEVTEVSTQDRGTGITNENGITGIYSGIFGESDSKIYKVRQLSAKQGYATVEDFYVKVEYDGDRAITSAKVVTESGEDPEKPNRFVQVTYTNATHTSTNFSTYNNNTKGIVQIEVKNYPAFKINITDTNRNDTVNNAPIAGTIYNVTSSYKDSEQKVIDFVSTNGVTTDSSGLGTAYLDKTLDSTVVTYKVTEVSPGTGYQSLGTEINIEVSYDSNGYVDNVQFQAGQNINAIAQVSKKNPTATDEDKFEIELALKNNPILKFNITAQDSVNPAIKIPNLGFTITSSNNGQTYSNSSATNRVNQSGTPQVSYTNNDGKTESYLDRTLENSTMNYTIKEVQKSAGYEWIDGDLLLNVSYDANGKISSTPVVAGSNTNKIKVTGYNADTFEIDITIYNDEIKEFGIHLTARDAYDKDKKISDMKVEAYLTDQGASTSDYVPDEEYALMGDESLLTGADRDDDKLPDLTYGEDYKKIKKYEGGNSTRTLRLVIKNSSTDGYYLDGNNNNLGYYNGSNYYQKGSYYQTVKYQYLISVTFDEDGKITNAKLKTGQDGHIGWLADGQYIEVGDGNTISHTDYALNITMKFYPMFNLKTFAMDNYTYNDEVQKNGEPTKLDGARFYISTSRQLISGTKEDEYVKAGYIGNGHDISYSTHVNGDIYSNSNSSLFVPIEKDTSRTFYIFEEAEPINYQTTLPRNTTSIYQHDKLIGIIQMTFDSLGNIDWKNSIYRNINAQAGGSNTSTPPYYGEDGKSYLSDNNLKEYNFFVTESVNHDNSGAEMHFYIGYALTTKITVTAIDDISGTPIQHIRMYPFMNQNDYCTKQSYEYYTGIENYRYTNSDGISGWTYWGAAEANDNNQYIIGSAREGTDYNGYLFPSDLASKELGGKGDPSAYYVKLDVAYGADGKISNITSLGSDLWGDNNVSNIKWDAETGNISVDVLFSRKFQMTLNKVDFYDDTINDLNASFNITSSEGLDATINAKAMTPVGKVYKNTTVKYTLSEVDVPDGYYPISNQIDYFVKFDANGNISTNNISSASEYFEAIKTADKTQRANKKTPDLLIYVKNKPALQLNLRVIDQFYKNDGLGNVKIQVTSSKKDQATGSPETDAQGYATIKAGPVYPGETVTYYIKETTTPAGYYACAAQVNLQVTYTDTGKISDYKIISGDKVVNNFDDKSFVNKKKIDMEIMNMPKDINIGLYKYDETKNAPMEGVKFEITRKDLTTMKDTKKEIITEANGIVTQSIDTFTTYTSDRRIQYTIHEMETPESFRKMEDVVFIIKYNADGSMASCNQVANDKGILNTNVSLDMATNGIIRHLNDQRVHFLVNVPNDNAFDLIIKDEDSNNKCSQLGIPGTQYDLSINEKAYNLNPTDNDGKTSLNNIVDPASGDINIRIAERTVGEGYKENTTNNHINIELEKGEQDYSLKLKQGTEGRVDDYSAYVTQRDIKVEVDEEHGVITVTFKNKSQTYLTLVKQNKNTKQALENVKFTVKAEKIIDNQDGSIQPEMKTLTTVDNNKTDANGQIIFDLGVSPVSEKWKYTFTEDETPEEYKKLPELTMTVTYDQYGRIQSQETSNAGKLIPLREHSDNVNCRDMYAVIYNEPKGEKPAYTVKVVTDDIDTGNRINGSEVYLNITKDDTTGELIPITPATTASAQNPSTTFTSNLGMDGNWYTDEQIKEEQIKTGKAPIILERGLTYIDNITYEGDIDIEVSEQTPADGYAFENNATDGHVKIKAEYIDSTIDGGDPTLKLTVKDRGNFEVITDDTNGIITIKIHNTSKVLFDITTLEYGSNAPIEGVYYDITAKIERPLETVQTNVNVTTELTDENGKTDANTGKAYAGETVVYTLVESPASGYNQMPQDIRIEVTYDSRGYIKYIEPLSSEEYVRIDDEKTIGGRIIYLTVKDRKTVGDYKVVLEKHAMDTDDDKNAYGTVIQGAKYEITVRQEQHGVENTTWKGTTDENGQIDGIPLDGYGFITVTIEELQAPDGYKLEDTKTIRLYRDRDTGKVEIVTTADLLYIENPNEDWSEIRLIPLDRQSENKYTLSLGKISSATNKYITDSQAKFTVVLEQTGVDGQVAYRDTIENVYTGVQGKVVLDNLDLPDLEGEFTLTITEEEAPDGYKLLEKPIKIKLNIIKTEEGCMQIQSISEEDITGNATITKYDKQFIGIRVMNDVDEQILEDEYSLDITKVDAETRQGIIPMAVFKTWLPDKANTAVYAETITTILGDGKLDYCYIEEERDSTLRLTHMKKPSVEEVQNAPQGILTYTYKFQEVSPPEGYALNDEILTLDIDFIVGKNESGEDFVKIKEARSSNDKVLIIVDQEDIKLKIDILNNAQVSSYTVHYDANTQDQSAGQGVTVPGDQLKQAGMPLTLDANVPTREGYTFREWNTDPNGDGTSFNPAGTYALDADVTLYAIWDVAQYKIHYEQNPPIDGSTNVAVGLVTQMPDDQIKTHNEDITLDDDGVTPTIPNVAQYYEFAGWNTDPNGTGTPYGEGAIYDLNEDLTLYAQWDYIIKYHRNEPTDEYGLPMGSAQNIPDDQRKNVNSTDEVIIDDLNIYTSAPSIQGYVFKEWNTSADGTGQAYHPNDVYTAKRGEDLYAIWQYEIIYNENVPLDESGFVANVKINNMPASPQVQDIGSVAVIANSTDNPNVPTTDPDDYIFVEWNTKPDGSGDSYNSDDEYKGNIGLTLYAIWEKEVDLYLKTTNQEYRITDAQIDDSRNRVTVKYTTQANDTYNDGDKYLLGILPQSSRRPSEEQQIGTSVALLKNDLDTNGTVKVYEDTDGNDILDPVTDRELADTEIVGTGMFLNVTKKNQEINLRLIVRGSTTAKGLISATEANIARIYIGDGDHTRLQKDYQKLALDVDLSGRIIASDATAINNMASLQCKYAYRTAIKVTLDLNGGTLIPTREAAIIKEELSVYEGATFSREANYNRLPNVEKAGMKFIGWFDDSGKQILDNVIVTNIVEPYTLHARFE